MIQKKGIVAWMMVAGFLAVVLVQPAFAAERTVQMSVPGCV